MAARASIALRLRRLRAERKADDAADLHARAVQELAGKRDPGRVDADRVELVLARLAAELLDVRPAWYRAAGWCGQ